MIKAAIISLISLTPLHHSQNVPHPLNLATVEAAPPEIQTGKIFTNNGAKYLCGMAKASYSHDDFRYLVALETEWITFEPQPNSKQWEDWDKNYNNFCHDTEANAQRFPEIIYGKFVIHKNDKFICGTSEDQKDHGSLIRYVISTKIDWQIWEPSTKDETWDGWNTTYEEICGPDTEE